DIVESGQGLTDANNDGMTDSPVGINGLDNNASAETSDDYTDVNGLAYEASVFTLDDTDNDVLADGSNATPLTADLDYRDYLPPDLTPIITALPNVMHGVTNFNITVRVTELNIAPTTGLITVIIPADSRWVFEGEGYNTSLTSLNFIDLKNDDWSYSLDEANWKHIFTSIVAIPAGDFTSFGFKALWDAGATKGVYTISATINSFSGGEVRINNNVDAEKIDYFIE
ncbi:MAG: hypothetical protein KAI79_19055, partial [Bacteroidales bacterium]|nr:hypothetical protein [Bacteroidales bacterium]